MSSGAIALFVKTPGLSPIKTRMATELGRRAAEAWHLHAAHAAASVLAEAAERIGVVPYWAVAERAALDAPWWQGFARIAQGDDGGLGTRMARVYATLQARHGFVVLLGADAPQLDLDLLCDACAWLRADEPRQALGPALDGGFWLYGGNRPVPSECWDTVAYSRPDTAGNFERALRPFGRWRRLPALRDVDRAEDLPALIAAIEALPTATAAQHALARWTQSLLASEAPA